MEFIKSIHVRYYRSLYDVNIINLSHLNIFSGKNDSGKSNILKLLDIYFNDRKINFDEDFNKNRLDEVRKSIKGKQFIDIQITFINNGNYTSLPELFSITKSYDRNGNLIGPPVDDLDKQIASKKFNPKSLEVTKRSLTTFINKIRYRYVPGIRDEQYFTNLLQDLQSALFEKEDRRAQTENSIKTTITAFNKYIRGITENLNTEFKEHSGIDTQLSFPNELTLLFRRLLVDTKSGNHDIPLYLRGDGIRLWYIPTILDFIARISPNYYIWGFDEPENSCEYMLASKLASDFNKTFSEKSQIFISTHSFSFISLESNKCSKYRVLKNEENNSVVYDIKNFPKHNDFLLQDIGVFHVNEQLQLVFNQYLNEITLLKELKKEVASKSRPILIFEGISDNMHFNNAFQKLYKKNIDTKYILGANIVDEKNCAIGDGASALNNFFYNYIGKVNIENVIIGVFDSDEEGLTQLKGLKKLFNDITSEFSDVIVYQHKTKKNVYVTSLKTPNYRKPYVDFKEPRYSYLSTELLYEDSYIPIQNRSYPSKQDKSVYSFNGKKVSFAELLSKTITKENLNGFALNFDFFDCIISRKSN